MTLSDENKKFLLALARSTIQDCLDGNKGKSLTSVPVDLEEMRGAFVTLKINDELRGCVGHIQPIMPLYMDVAENVINAAFNDARFCPLSGFELGSVVIEISVLSVPKIVSVSSSKDYFSKIEIGKHGIIIERNGCSAVFLPQVPVEQGWDVKEYLSQLCYKAGLSVNAWMESDAKIYSFEAEVFGEDNI